MIRSTKVTTKYCNKIKSDKVNNLIKEYRRIIIEFIDIMWTMDKVPSLVSSELRSKISESWLGTRMIQCAGKQASGIVRGTKKKQEKRLFQINKFIKQCEHKKARKLQSIYDNVKLSKPELKSIQLELDERFIKLDLSNDSIFDGWVTLKSIGSKEKITIPFKKTKHFNKLSELGTLKKGLRLSEKSLTFMFDVEPAVNTNNKVVGIDIGLLTAITCSDSQVSKKDNHNHDLNSINKKLSGKKKGSKSFSKTQKQRTDYINWSINRLNLSDVKEIKIENIKNLRKGKKSSRSLSHWTYTEIFNKLKSKAEELNVLITTVSPTYTSQRCSQCSFTHRNNRKGKIFKCGQCGFTLDSDLNGALNIVAKLKPVGKQQRLKQISKKGFYWLAEGQEFIVPDVDKTDFIIFSDFCNDLLSNISDNNIENLRNKDKNFDTELKSFTSRNIKIINDFNSVLERMENI